MSSVKNENSVTICGWMINELNLSGDELMIYAIIYGVTQGIIEQQVDLEYLIDWTKTGEVTVQIALISLTRKGLLQCRRDEFGNFLYKAIRDEDK